MLKTLKIKNVALIEEATVNFDKGLNIISGETGAGKSVLLDCINLVLGCKTDKSLIKNGKEFLKVDGIFDIDETDEIKSVFSDLDIDFDSCIIISRKISIDGKNEVKINGETVPLGYLKTISKCLIDIHSQNENLTLLNKTNQLKLIDSFTNFDFSNLKKICSEISDINDKINLLDRDEGYRARELELLDYQIKEIENAKLREDEEQELRDELLMLKNSEKIATSLNCINDNYQNDSQNISSLMKKIIYEANNLVKYKNDLKPIEERINSAFIDLDDSITELISSFDLTFDENRFNEIDQRLDLYKSLHKKYGNSYEEITKFLKEIKEKQCKFLNYEEELSNLKNDKNQLLNSAFDICKEITKKRKQCANELEKKIITELKDLSMPNGKIVFEFNDYNKTNFENVLTNIGADNVIILFSANLGEEIKPLNLVASGGEISRLMLAIKTITSEKDKIPTMIFDELDTGISGSASVSTSKKLAKISKNHQIIAVSHLFQICAMADKNILVKKIEENGKTVSLPYELKPEDAVFELCRFLSVDEITEATILHAKEVKDYLNNYKKSI